MNRHKRVNPCNSLFVITAVLLFFAGLLLLPVRAGWADDATRILVVPFSINAAGDLSFMQRGITDMLTSRLEKDQQVDVLTPDPKDDKDIATLARNAAADYVVTGSVTILGNSVSTDAQVAKASALDEPVLSFGQTGDEHADVIDHVHQLAAMINARLLGGEPDQPDQTAAPAPSAVVPVPIAGQAVTPPSAPAPQVPAPSQSQLQQAGQAPGPIEPMPLPGMGTIKGQLNGITAGDLDGDGVSEIVTVTDSDLYVFRFNQGRWVGLAEYDSRGDFIGVDTADLNRNGREEIFVTRFSQNEGQVRSFVLEWDGKALQRIASQLPWYFRCMDTDQWGRVIVGQRFGRETGFASGIYQIQWTANAYTTGERMVLPHKLNVFGLAYGAIRSPDQTEVATYNSDGYVDILNSSGEETGTSTEHYGGGSTFITFVDEAEWDSQNHVYLSPRIRLHDMDGDGLQEILVIKNQGSFTGSSVLERHRFYAKGRLEWLKWKASGIRSIAQTLDMAKFISDSALVDVDGDGRLEVVAAVVKKTRGVTSKGSSYLTSFRINPVK